MKKVFSILVAIGLMFCGIATVSATSRVLYNNTSFTVAKGFSSDAYIQTLSTTGTATIIPLKMTEGTKMTIVESYLNIGSTYFFKGSSTIPISIGKSSTTSLGNIGAGKWKVTIRAKIAGGDICAGWTGTLRIES